MLQCSFPTEAHYKTWMAENRRWRGLLSDFTASTLKAALIYTQIVWFVKHTQHPFVRFSTWFAEVLEMMSFRPEFKKQLPLKPFEQHFLEFFLVECSFHVMEALLNLCGHFNDELGNSLETSYFMPLMSLYVAGRDEAKRLVGGFRSETLKTITTNSEGVSETSSYTCTSGAFVLTVGSYYPLPKPCKEDWQVPPVPWDKEFEDPESEPCRQRFRRDRAFMDYSSEAVEFKNGHLDDCAHLQDWQIFRRFVYSWLQDGFYSLVSSTFDLQPLQVRTLMDAYEAKAVVEMVDRVEVFREEQRTKRAEEASRAAQREEVARNEEFNQWLQECRLENDGNVKEAVPLKWVDFKDVVKQRFKLADNVVDAFLKKFNLRCELKKLNKAQKRKREEVVPVIRAVFEGNTAVLFRDDKKNLWSLPSE